MFINKKQEGQRVFTMLYALIIIDALRFTEVYNLWFMDIIVLQTET